jgi:hypothetical protein
MVIVGIISFPLESSSEVGKRLSKLPPPPPFIKVIGPFVSAELGTGIKGMTLYEFDQTKAGEATIYVTDRYTKYIGVPGLTYSVATWLEAIEALKMIGLG